MSDSRKASPVTRYHNVTDNRSAGPIGSHRALGFDKLMETRLKKVSNFVGIIQNILKNNSSSASCASVANRWN